MQPSPFLTILKILAFACLAFLVGVSTCQKGNLEDKVTSLEQRVSGLSRGVEELTRAVRSGSAAPAAGGPAATGRRGWEPPARQALDEAADPSLPAGKPGRYRDFLADDPFREVPPGAEGQDQGTITRWLGPEPKGFNFVTENDAGISDYVEIYVADAAAWRHVKDPDRWRPGACWRVEVSPDFREYTLHFRPGMRWHTPAVDLARYPHLDGVHEVTARDYKFTLDVIRNPQTDCAPLRGYYTDVESVELVDDLTCVVRWKKTLWHSIAFTLSASIMPEFLYAYGEDGKRFPEATLGQSFNSHWFNRVGFVGSGPYQFVSYERGQRIVLERFEDFYRIVQGVRYPVARIRLLIFPDQVTNLLKITSGEINLGALNSPQWKEVILDNKDPKSPFLNGEIEHWIGYSAAYLYFGWKNTHPLFRDARVRTALAHACNREAIARDIFLDRYRVMSSPIYPDSAQADPELKPLPFDLGKARALLDEAGWRLNPSTGLREKEVDGERRRFEFVLLWPGPASDFEAALNQYKNDLLAIGVRMDPQSMEWAAYQKKLQDREFEACSLLWAMDGWDHDFDQIWHSRGIQDPGSSNHVEFSNAEVDRLSDELRETMDPRKRVEVVRRVGRILYEEQPYCFFGWRNVFAVNRADVRNARFQYRIRPFTRTFPLWVGR